jgi:hypothetical protein
MRMMSIKATIIANKKTTGLPPIWRVDEVIFENDCRGLRVTGLSDEAMVEWLWEPDTILNTVKGGHLGVAMSLQHNTVDIIQQMGEMQ